jgi:hypothetical protein
LTQTLVIKPGKYLGAEKSTTIDFYPPIKDVWMFHPSDPKQIQKYLG